MSTPRNPVCILSALHLNPDTYEWLKVLYANLPLFVVNESNLGKSCFDAKNAKWQRLMKTLTEVTAEEASDEARFSCAQRVKRDIEVFVHKELDHIKIEPSDDGGPVLRVSVSLDNTKLKAALKENLESEVVHVSLLSGLLINVPTNLVCLVTSVYKEQTVTPSIVAIDSSNIGPLYLGCFVQNPFLFVGSCLNVVFEFNVFRALTKNSRLVHRDDALTCSREKRVKKDEDKFVKDVASLKSLQSSLIGEITQPTLAGIEREEGASSCEVRLCSHLSLVVENCHLIDTFAVVLCPRPKYSHGKQHTYSIGAGVFTVGYTRQEVQPRVSEWLHEYTNELDGKCSLCMSVLGECANNEFSVLLVSSINSWIESCKRGVNGYMFHLLGEELYKEIVTYCKQVEKIRFYMPSIESFTQKLVTKYGLLGGKKNSSLVQLRIKKALLYLFAFTDSQSCLLAFDIRKPKLSNEHLLEIAHHADLIDAEEMADFFCSKYDCKVESRVVATLGVDRPSTCKSFMNVLSTSHLELLQKLQAL